MGFGGIADEDNLKLQAASRHAGTIAEVLAFLSPKTEAPVPLPEPSEACQKKLAIVDFVLSYLWDELKSECDEPHVIEVDGGVDEEFLDCIRALLPGLDITTEEKFLAVIRENTSRCMRITKLKFCRSAAVQPASKRERDAPSVKPGAVKIARVTYAPDPDSQYMHKNCVAVGETDVGSGYVALGPGSEVFYAKPYPYDTCMVGAPQMVRDLLKTNIDCSLQLRSAEKPALSVASVTVKLVDQQVGTMHPGIALSSFTAKALADATVGMVLAPGRSFLITDRNRWFQYMVETIELVAVPGITDKFGVVTEKTKFTEAE